MNIKKLNEELEKYLESSLPYISKMNKICDLDKHLTESGRYIGRRDSKWNIYKYVRTSRKFNGGYNYNYKVISPDFDTQDEAIEWFANDLLNNNSEEDLYDCIKEGSFVIYDDKLNAQLGTTNIKAGKLDTTPRFRTNNKGIDPVPQYMLEPNKAKANNLRIDYIKTHGKDYEVKQMFKELNEELEKYLEEVPVEYVENLEKAEEFCRLYICPELRKFAKDYYNNNKGLYGPTFDKIKFEMTDSYCAFTNLSLFQLSAGGLIDAQKQAFLKKLKADIMNKLEKLFNECCKKLEEHMGFKCVEEIICDTNGSYAELGIILGGSQLYGKE